MKRHDRLHVLLVSCPHCGVLADQECTDAFGGRASQPHMKRVRLAHQNAYIATKVLQAEARRRR